MISHTCQLHADEAMIISMLVAHLAGYFPHIPPSHPEESQGVLIIIRHAHLTVGITILEHHASPGRKKEEEFLIESNWVQYASCG